MRYRNVEALTRMLSAKPEVEATKDLTRFFVDARFGVVGEDFARQYVDGANDGGIDFFHVEEEALYVIQTKYSSAPRQTSDDTVKHELKKLINTLTSENPNRRADEFVNEFRRNIADERLVLEIVWLTSNYVKGSTIDAAQQKLLDTRREKGWGLDVDFVAFDKDALGRMISDVAHGYVPYTGKKVLPISRGTDGARHIEYRNESTGIYSVVCTVNLTDLLRWIRKKQDIERFLQKNVRGYLGEKAINREVKKSFLTTPDWFWYKHNGIIIFADGTRPSRAGHTGA